MVECASGSDGFDDGEVDTKWTAANVGTASQGSQWEDGLVVASDGSTLWAGYNSFRYVYQEGQEGAFTATVQIVLAPDAATSAKAGLMVRAEGGEGGPAADSSFAMIMYLGQTGKLQLVYRHDADTPITVTNELAVALPVWVRLVREGDAYTYLHSSDGVSWTEDGSASPGDMGEEPLVGLAVASYNSSKVDRGAFAHFELCREVAAPEAGFVGWPVSGPLPLTVTFVNTSTGQVTGCLWSYGDGVTGTTSLMTHTHVYTQAGVYTVSLAATGPGGTDALTRTGYITVTGRALSTTVISYTYDPLNRLTGAEYSTGESFAYQYNEVGNRTRYTETITQTVVTTYAYDAANRLTNREMSNGWTYTYTWSNRGEMLAEWILGYAVRTFAYNVAGQMAEATVFTLTTHFRYNGDGARVAVEVVGRGTTTYTLDYAGGYRVLAEQTLTGTVLYLYGRDCLGEQRDGEWLYYLSDATGYVRQGADEQGQVASAWLFDPDGVVLIGPEGPVSHLVCGGVYDWSTGLIFKGNRYFDPTLGIWLSLAPLVVVQGWKGRKKRRWWQRWYVMVVILAGVGGMLVGCGPVTIEEATKEVCTTIPAPTPTPTIFERSHYVKGLTPEGAAGYYQHQTTYDCGPYATAIAANIYQGASNFSGAQVNTEMTGRSADFTPPEAIVNYLNGYGIPAQAQQHASEADLLEYLDRGLVVIIKFETSQFLNVIKGHWVVLYGYEPERTVNLNGKDIKGRTWGYIDPGQPNVKLAWWPEAYRDKWAGVCVLVGGSKQ